MRVRPDDEVQVAWRCYQQLRIAYRAKDAADGKAVAKTVLEKFYSCPIPEVARLGSTLRRWRKEFLGYFTTTTRTTAARRRSTPIIELHRRIALGYRNGDHYRLPMLLVAAGLLLLP